jgi:membrane associated rhomboid family serine protease
MIFPVGDVQKQKTFPFVNLLLIATNVAVFVWMFFLVQPQEHVIEIVNTHALVPNRWMEWKTLLTSIFMHGGPAHLFFNMLFLFIAGDNVEDRLGHLGYLVFYVLAGLAGSLTHVYMALGPLSSMAGTPTIGASGAISGVVGAYLVFFPKSKIKFVIVLVIFLRYFTLPAWGVIPMWLGSQILLAWHQYNGIAKDEQMTVAVFAHLGGFAFGFAWALLARMFGKPPRKREE